MSDEGEKEALRKLIMLISELRAKDEERYEAHVNFMNETIKMISAIESQMNKHWSTVLDSLKELNENISTNLDSLLTGINPGGLKETSKSLNEIMDTMNKSIQSMNLEKVISELNYLKSGGTYQIQMPVQVATGVVAQPEEITAGLVTPQGSSPPAGLKSPGKGTAGASSEVEWVDPTENRTEQDDDDDESRLLKPSDFFGM
ncbi:MAG: hypothetical protein ACFFAS_00095 [Promethearchaeota archaeon]